MADASRKFGTKCPKIGRFQWTCSHEECECHLKDFIPRTFNPEPPKATWSKRNEAPK